jgi:FkbM family methyltransferase
MTVWEKYNIAQNDWDSLVSIKFSENVVVGGTYCDVGACNGVITRFFKNLTGENGMVYAFELNPFNYNAIQSLQTENCIIENLAISDEISKVTIYGDDQRPGNHISNIVGHDTAFRKMNVIGEANSTTLDEYFKDKKVDCLKIDVEGAELKVIKGGLNTILNAKYVIIECHFDSQWPEIYEFITSHNMDFRYLVNDESVKLEDMMPSPGIGKNGNPYQMYLKN